MKHSKSNICPYLHIQCDKKEKSGGKYGYKNNPYEVEAREVASK